MADGPVGNGGDYAEFVVDGGAEAESSVTGPMLEGLKLGLPGRRECLHGATETGAPAPSMLQGRKTGRVQLVDEAARGR